MKDCSGELLGRVRKGLVSDQERTAFEAHIAGCDACRMTLEVTGDFDAVGEAEPGDWERVARMATRAAAMHGARSRAPLRVARGPWPLMVAALVFAGAAVAGGAIWLVPRSAVETESPSQEDSVKELRGKARATELVDAPADSPSEVTKEEAEPAAALPVEVVAPTGSQTTAADIYRGANDARRAGKSHDAILGYQRLQRDYPGSAEAHASRVSLGGLLLKNGSSSAALAQFDAYLASDGGRLAAEALFGRAQALRALGRSADEAQNLQRLVKNYPNSAYATHAKRRLSQLR